MNLETQHRIALAREVTAEAGYPLRDRYGYAASDDDVFTAIKSVLKYPNDQQAADDIGMANMNGDIQLAMGYDTPTDEEYELGIVRAIRPMIEERRDAAVRATK